MNAAISQVMMAPKRNIARPIISASGPQTGNDIENWRGPGPKAIQVPILASATLLVSAASYWIATATAGASFGKLGCLSGTCSQARTSTERPAAKNTSPAVNPNQYDPWIRLDGLNSPKSTSVK